MSSLKYNNMCLSDETSLYIWENSAVTYISMYLWWMDNGLLGALGRVDEGRSEDISQVSLIWQILHQYMMINNEHSLVQLI